MWRERDRRGTEGCRPPFPCSRFRWLSKSRADRCCEITLDSCTSNFALAETSDNDDFTAATGAAPSGRARVLAVCKAGPRPPALSQLVKREDLEIVESVSMGDSGGPQSRVISSRATRILFAGRKRFGAAKLIPAPVSDRLLFLLLTSRNDNPNLRRRRHHPPGAACLIDAFRCPRGPRHDASGPWRRCGGRSRTHLRCRGRREAEHTSVSLMAEAGSRARPTRAFHLP